MNARLARDAAGGAAVRSSGRSGLRAGAVGAMALVAALAAAPGPARAQGQRLVVDQATLEPSSITGAVRLRVFASAIDLAGNVVAVSGDRAWKLVLGGSEKKLPYAVTLFGGSAYPMAIAFVVETTPEYAGDFAVMQKVLEEELLSKLGPEVQVGVVGYDEKVSGSIKLGDGKAARTKLDGLELATIEAEPVMLDAVDRAVGALKKLRTEPEGIPTRKLVIVLSDGRDKTPDKARTTRIGKRAGKDGIRIHTLAYSPSDTRTPMLSLGELSRQSLGTFRWVRSKGAAAFEQSFRGQVANLRSEILQQYVVTFYAPAEEVVGKKVSLVADLHGKPLAATTTAKVPDAPSCGGVTCASGAYCVAQKCIAGGGGGRGVLGWILLVGGIAIGVIVALGFIGFLLTKRKAALERRARLAAAAGLTSAPPPGVVPGSVPPVGEPADGRIMGVPSYASPGSALPASAPPSSAPPAMEAQRIAPIVAGQSTVGAYQAAQPTLYVMSGARAGQRLPLRHGFVIGKAPDCDLPLDDGFASSQHAMILMDGRGNCLLQDRGSTNGTFVNGVRVAADIALTHGMTIRIGSTDLRFLAQ